MVSLDQLKEHIKKAKTEFDEGTKKVEDPKNDPAIRLKLKKVKRLERKAAKLTATAKMAEERKKPKKERKSTTEG